MNPKVDAYLVDGCGRCPLGGTPDCKVHRWTDVLIELRRIVLECGLSENLKWSMPCYDYRGKNILILSAFKEYSSLNFFKGSLLQDTEGILVKPGENSQASRLLAFTRVADVLKNEATIKAYIFEAIEVEKSGLKVKFKDVLDYAIPEELTIAFGKNPDLKESFNALTPGRQKGYLLHFSQPKQSATRTSRIVKCTPKILKGLGWNDR